MGKDLASINADLARKPDLRPIVTAWAKTQHALTSQALYFQTSGGDNPAPLQKLTPWTSAVKRGLGLHREIGKATGEMLALYRSPSAVKVASDGRSALIAAPTAQTRKKVGLFISGFTQYATPKQAAFLTNLGTRAGAPRSWRAGEPIPHPARDFLTLSKRLADIKAAEAAEHVLRGWGFA